MKRSLAILLAVVALSGCSRGPGKPPTPVDPNALFGRIDEMIRGGQTNEALETASKAIDDPVYAKQRAALFRGYLGILLSAGRGEEAAQTYLGRLADADLARSGYDLLLGYRGQSGPTNAVENWTRQLLEKPLPTDVQGQNIALLADALLVKAPFERVLELVPVCLRRLDPPMARRVLEHIFGAVLGAGRYAEAQRLIDAIAAQGGGRTEVEAMVTVAGINLLVRQGQWSEAEAKFKASADKLPEADLQRVVSLIGAEGQLKQQWDLVDRVCRLVLDKKGVSPAPLREAASQWVAAGQQRAGSAEALTRLSALLDAAVDSSLVATLYSRHFYAALDANNKDLPQRLTALAERLMAEVKGEAEKGALQSMLFDASFMAADYQRALSILQSGALGRDADWQKMAENKLLAHIALKEGRTDEAVQRFRQFMDYVAATWKEPERDPMTRIQYTKEMTLGLNARRIGDILKEAGKGAEADKAYEEARGDFEKARGTAEADSPEAGWIKQQLAALPERKAKE